MEAFLFDHCRIRSLLWLYGSTWRGRGFCHRVAPLLRTLATNRALAYRIRETATVGTPCPHRHGPGNARSSLTALGSSPWPPEARKGDKRRTLLSLRSSHPALPNYLTQQPGHIGGILRLLQKPRRRPRRGGGRPSEEDREPDSSERPTSEKRRPHVFGKSTENRDASTRFVRPPS